VQTFIREIWLYPVKSLGGVRVQQAAITTAGSLALDREWLVVDADDRMLWQGDIPRMTLVRVALDQTTLTLTMDGMEPLVVARDHAGEPCTLTMYKRTFTGIDAGNVAAHWLTRALGQPVRLVRIGDAAHRWDGLNPVHVVSDASIAALNEALREQGDDDVAPRRFRPNVILGNSSPFAEEENAVLDFGDAKLRLREPCVRCELPNISLIDASRGKQPLKFLGKWSAVRPNAKAASFGTYCSAEGTMLRTGMVAEIA
jgi:uncharacterized protein YcbX